MKTSLQGIAQKARTHKKHRFRDLYRMLNEENLHESWKEIRKDAAYGVDHVSAEEYEKELSKNIRELVKRLKEKRYRAQLVRRQYIPKENGKLRPLGIPAVEDKLVQRAVAKILEAIYEQDFLESSYGYRPGRGVHDAVEKLKKEIQFGVYRWILDADIQGYFDNIDHEWLMRMLRERIDDGAFLRLIEKWLRAGVLDTDGKILHPETGTPQGGIVSPVLANVYLHYVLDLWFEKVEKKGLKRKSLLVRYADDFVCAFECESDVRKVREALGARMSKFGLKLSEEKTRVIPFTRSSREKFDFLGFEYKWGRDRKGNAHLQRQTSRKKLRAVLKRMTLWCKASRHGKLGSMMKTLAAKLAGYNNHYGVTCNYRRLQEYFNQTERILFKWLNRRSQRKSFTWEEFQELKERYRLPRPRIVRRPQPLQLALC